MQLNFKPMLASQIDDEIPEILVSDDIDLSVYVTPHVY